MWVDISHTLNGHTPIFPGDFPTSLAQSKTLQQDGYTAYTLHTELHTGTHIDMPMHLLDTQGFASGAPLEAFCGRGVLLDARDANPISATQTFAGQMEPGDIVLLHTGWDSRYFDSAYFSQHPSIDESFARLLVDKQVKMLGIDMPAPDHAPYTLHKYLLAQGVLLLENLTNLQALPFDAPFEVFAFPLKIDAEASLVRAACRV